MKHTKKLLLALTLLLLALVPAVLSEIDPLKDIDDDDEDVDIAHKNTKTGLQHNNDDNENRYAKKTHHQVAKNGNDDDDDDDDDDIDNEVDGKRKGIEKTKLNKNNDDDDDDEDDEDENDVQDNNINNNNDNKDGDNNDDNDDNDGDDAAPATAHTYYESILDRIEKWVERLPETTAELKNTDWDEAEAQYIPPTGINPLKESEQGVSASASRAKKWKLTLAEPLEDKWGKEHPGRPFRVLWVSEFEVYTTSMSRWYFHTFESFKQLPGVEAYLWGPGFQGWDDTLTTSQNINKRWGDPLYFDFLMNHTFKRNDGRDWLGIGTPATPVAVWHHECTYNERLPTKDISIVLPCSHEANIVFHAYAGNMAYYSAQSSVGDRLLWHLPHAVHLPLMSSQSNPLSDRKTDVLLVGRIWSVYPLRQRFQKLIEDGKMPGKAVHYQHPGYWFPDGPDSRTPEAVEKQGAEYLRQLENAKIVLMCTSKRRYAVRKYMEAAAAGALIIADIPEEREDEFRKFVVEVNLTDSDDVLIETVRWWLDHPKERIERATLGQKIVLSKYRSDMASKSIVTAMKRYIGGQRGMAFPYPFAQIDHFLPKTKACMKVPKKTRP